MKSRYAILTRYNVDLAFFSTNMNKHLSVLKSFDLDDIHALFAYCKEHNISVFAMSNKRGFVEELKEIDWLISDYDIRMTSTQLSYLGCVL